MIGGKRRKQNPKITTLIGHDSKIQGDVIFTGGLHVDGIIKGAVIADNGSEAVLTLSEQGKIEGEVKVPYVVINGVVVGDVYAGQRVELGEQARISGNVYYNLIEMAIGAEVNGQMVHAAEVVPEAEKKAVPPAGVRLVDADT